MVFLQKMVDLSFRKGGRREFKYLADDFPEKSQATNLLDLPVDPSPDPQLWLWGLSGAR